MRQTQDFSSRHILHINAAACRTGMLIPAALCTGGTYWNKAKVDGPRLELWCFLKRRKSEWGSVCPDLVYCEDELNFSNLIRLWNDCEEEEDFLHLWRNTNQTDRRCRLETLSKKSFLVYLFINYWSCFVFYSPTFISHIYIEQNLFLFKSFYF